MINVKKITENKSDYLSLLLIADPSVKAIDKYLDQSDLFVMFDEDEPVCAAALVKVSEDTCELKNIAAGKLRHGYGSKMLEFLFGYYNGKYDYMEVGTGNSSTGNISFYQKNGFEITHQIDNFFIDNYNEPIFEDGVQCVHMIMLKKRL
jgi:ribosomal protein S18 acetylase RimI-like enzyme